MNCLGASYSGEDRIRLERPPRIDDVRFGVGESLHGMGQDCDRAGSRHDLILLNTVTLGERR